MLLKKAWFHLILTMYAQISREKKHCRHFCRALGNFGGTFPPQGQKVHAPGSVWEFGMEHWSFLIGRNSRHQHGIEAKKHTTDGLMKVVSCTESREVFLFVDAAHVCRSIRIVILPMSYAMKSAEKHLAPLLSDVSLWVLPPKTSSVPLSTTAEWRYRARPLSPRISLHTHTHTHTKKSTAQQNETY